MSRVELTVGKESVLSGDLKMRTGIFEVSIIDLKRTRDDCYIVELEGRKEDLQMFIADHHNDILTDELKDDISRIS